MIFWTVAMRKDLSNLTIATSFCFRAIHRVTIAALNQHVESLGLRMHTFWKRQIICESQRMKVRNFEFGTCHYHRIRGLTL